jgi:hypothetical protein
MSVDDWPALSLYNFPFIKKRIKRKQRSRSERV